MDCYEPVDDYCNAWQPHNLQIPPNTCNFDLDQFFIAIELEVTRPVVDDCEEDEQEEENCNFLQVESNDLFTFWAPCPRIEHGNLPNDKISSMLSRAGVPKHKQRFMVDMISSRADEIANAARNEDTRVLPMIISISIVACLCYGETVIDPEQPNEGFVHENDTPEVASLDFDKALVFFDWK
ncbi:hypothetical protein CASFOL_017545 [Castilleja foliolosa]|uniref:Uncharacterized protein n=1 Tax=Castilleja foliolosa TaxID=1961234 RepID=A0ABD3DBT8_9LAMI